MEARFLTDGVGGSGSTREGGTDAHGTGLELEASE